MLDGMCRVLILPFVQQQQQGELAGFFWYPGQPRAGHHPPFVFLVTQHNKLIKNIVMNLIYL
jgi:hypothetical protein